MKIGMNKNAGLFVKNVIYAIGANLSRIFTTLILTLLLPKVLTVEDYSYWQLYHFYATYFAYSTLGWTEGLYMKYGGIRYHELDRKRISFQIWGISVHEIIFACLIILAGEILLQTGDVKKQLLAGAAIYTIFHVVLSQLQAVLQASGRISDYAGSYSMERLLFLAASTCCILGGLLDFRLFIVIEILSNAVLMCYTAFLCRKVVFVKPVSLLEGIREECGLIRIGFSISFAGFLGQLVIGVVRLGVEQKWGTVAFGMLSLSFSMANMAVTCITAVSIVVFPALKRLERNRAEFLYLPVRDLMTYTMLGVLILYVPARVLLTLWLPEYEESIRYLAVLLPLCIYEVRNSVLTCTYLKAWMEQKYIMYANITVLVVSVLATWVNVFVIGNIELAVFSILGLYALKAILTEIAIKKCFPVKLSGRMIQELFLTGAFTAFSWFDGSIVSTTGYLLCYGIFLLCKRKRLNEAYHIVKGVVS